MVNIDAMSDEDINTADIPPLTEETFAKVQLKSANKLPQKAINTLVEIDPETLVPNFTIIAISKTVKRAS